MAEFGSFSSPCVTPPDAPVCLRLSGCYESLDGGNTGDAIVDFSGAVAESISLETEAFYKEPEKEQRLFEDLFKVFDRGGLISCSIKVCPAVHLSVEWSVHYLIG